MLIHKNYYNFIFQKYNHKRILLCLPYGNVGDQIIWQSCFQLLDYNNIQYDTIKNNPNIQNQVDQLDINLYDAFLWCGGGNMGNLYKINYLFRQIISAKLKTINKKLIILPQTWTSIDDIEAEKYYAREHMSIKLYEPNALFAHDLALSYEIEDDIKIKLCSSPSGDIGFFFREDVEKIDLFLNEKNIGDPAKLSKTYQDYILLASKYKEIHTNRLHFAIAALLLDRVVKLYPNSYFKNEAIYFSSLQNYSNIEFIHEC